MIYIVDNTDLLAFLFITMLNFFAQIHFAQKIKNKKLNVIIYRIN